MEKIDREEYKRDLFERLKSSLGLKREEECFGACLGDASWWILEKSGYTAQELKLAVSQTCVLQKRPGSKKTGVVKPLCLKSVADTVKRARRTKRPETFVCPGGRHGFVYPIIQGDAIYGFVGVCYTKRDISSRLLGVLPHLPIQW